jgi:tetratricopeptide (TPR) repeat protein
MPKHATQRPRRGASQRTAAAHAQRAAPERAPGALATIQQQPASPDPPVAPADAGQPTLFSALTGLALLAALVAGLIVSLRLWRRPTSLTELGTYIQVLYPVLVSATLTTTAAGMAKAFLLRCGLPERQHDKVQFGGALLLFFGTLALLLSMPWQASYHNNVGTRAREAGDTFRALAAFQQGVAYDPENASVYYNLGSVYEDLNRPADAIAAYERALELTAVQQTTQTRSVTLPPTWFAATNNLARLLILSGEPGQVNRALDMLTTALHSQPPAEMQATLYRNLALSQVELGLFYEARNNLGRARELAPDSHSTACVAALFAEADGNPFAAAAAARDDWQKCLGATPDESVPARWLAIARERVSTSP